MVFERLRSRIESENLLHTPSIRITGKYFLRSNVHLNVNSKFDQKNNTRTSCTLECKLKF